MDKMKRLWNLRFGTKGFVFSLDIVMAFIVVILFVVASIYFSSKGNYDNITDLQLTKIADDITTVLDYNKRFDSLDRNIIRSNIDGVLPDNYNMTFRIECNNKIIQSVDKIPETFVAGGERVIVTNNMDFCMMRYWLWAL